MTCSRNVPDDHLRHGITLGGGTANQEETGTGTQSDPGVVLEAVARGTKACRSFWSRLCAAPCQPGISPATVGTVASHSRNREKYPGYGSGKLLQKGCHNRGNFPR